MDDERGNRLAGLEIRLAPDCQTEWEQHTVFDFLGNAEIGNLDAALVVDEDIPAFDVSMDDVFLVQIG